MLLACCAKLQVRLNLNLTQNTTIFRGLINPYSLCLDLYAQQLYYIQGGNGGSLWCHAYGHTACYTEGCVMISWLLSSCHVDVLMG